MTKKLKVTPITMSVHREGENPVFSDCATHVTIDDEAAGPFVILSQSASENNSVRLDLDELQVIARVANMMAKKHLGG